MKRTPLIPIAVLVAGFVCAATAHADGDVWVGVSPTGGMITTGPPGTVSRATLEHITGRPIEDFHMSAANGCEEDWTLMPSNANTPTHGWFGIHVTAGAQGGCEDTTSVEGGWAMWDMFDNDKTMIITQPGGAHGIATWELHRQ
jgi:hypothetical protein